jgi:hypothetical protein
MPERRPRQTKWSKGQTALARCARRNIIGDGATFASHHNFDAREILTILTRNMGTVNRVTWRRLATTLQDLTGTTQLLATNLTCTECLQDLPEDAFSGGYADGPITRDSVCNECENRRSRERRANLTAVPTPILPPMRTLENMVADLKKGLSAQTAVNYNNQTLLREIEDLIEKARKTG